MNLQNLKIKARKIYSEAIFYRVFHLFTTDIEAYFTASLSLIQFLSLMGSGIFYSQSKETSIEAGTSILKIFFFLFTMMEPINSHDSDILIEYTVGIIFLTIFLAFHILVIAYLIFGDRKNVISKNITSFLAFYSFYYPNLMHFILQNIGMNFIKNADLPRGIDIFIIILIFIGNAEAIFMLIYTNDTIFVRNQLARKKLAVNYVEYIIKCFLSYFIIFQAEIIDPITFRLSLNLLIFLMICVCLSQPTFYYPKMFTLSLTLRTMTQCFVLFPLLYSNFMQTGMEYFTWPIIAIAFLIILKISINARRGIFNPILDRIWSPKTVNDALNCYFQAYEIFDKIQFTSHTNKPLSQSELYARGLLKNVGSSLLSDENISLNNKYILKRSLERENLIEVKDLVLENLMRRYYLKFKSDILGFNLLTKMILNETQVNYSQIVMMLHKLRKSRWTMYQQALINMLVKVLKEGKIENKLLDVDKIVNFEQKYDKLLDAIIKEGKLHCEFWENCKKQNVSAEKIFEIAQEIDLFSKKISSQWEKIEKRQLYKGPHFYFLYGYYQNVIRNDPTKQLNFIKKIQKNYIANNNKYNSLITEDVLDVRNTVITISGDQKNIGEILFCSEGIKNFLGFGVDDLVHKNLNIIIPKIIQKSHLGFIQHFLDTNEYRIIDKLRPIYAIDQEGYIIPSDSIIKFYPFSRMGLTFTAVLRRNDHFGEAIIFMKDGGIAGCTRGISKKLGLSIKDINLLKIGDVFEDIEYLIEEEMKKNFPYEYAKCKALNYHQPFEILDAMINSVPNEIKQNFKENYLKLNVSKMNSHVKSREITSQSLDSQVDYEKFTDFNLFILKIENFNPKHNLTRSLVRSGDEDKDLLLDSNADSARDLTQKFLHEKNDKTTKRSQFVKIKQIQADTCEDQNSSEINADDFKFSSNKLEEFQTARENQALIPEPSVASSKKSSELKLYQSYKLAIDESYRPTSIKILRSNLVCFVTLSLIFFSLIGIYGDLSISYISSMIKIISIAELRQDALIEYARRARLAKITKDELIPLNRHASIGVPNYFSFTVTKLFTQSELLLGYNQQLLGNLSSLETEYKNLLFEKNIDINYSSKLDSRSGFNLIEKKNTFDACEEIAWAGIPIFKRGSSSLKSDDPDLQFILSNSLNDIYNGTVRSVSLLDRSIEKKLDDYLILIMTLLGTLIGTGIIILGGSIIYNSLVYRKTIHLFLEAFVRINMKEADFIQEKIKSIINHLLKTKKKDISTWNRSAYDKLKMKRIDINKLKSDSKKKGYTVGRMLINPLKDALFLFSVVILSTIMIAIIFQKFETFRDSSMKMKNRIIFSISDLSSLGIAMTSAYEFVSEDMSTTVLNEPISNIINKLLASVGNIQQSFESYSNDKVRIEEKFAPYVTGDLCVTSATSKEICSLDEKFSGDGILGVKTFISTSLKSLRDNYQKSNRTFEAKKEALQEKDLVSIERMMTVTVRPAYVKLQSLLQSDMDEYLSNYKEDSKILVIISIILMLILPALVLRFVMRKLLGQYDRIKKILKPVPVQMLNENKNMLAMIKKLSPHTNLLNN